MSRASAGVRVFIPHPLTKYPPAFREPVKTIFPCSFNFFIQRSMVFEGIFNVAAISTTRFPGFLLMNSSSFFIPSFIPSFVPSFIPSFIPPFIPSLVGRRKNFTTKAPAVSLNSGLGLPFKAHPSTIRCRRPDRHRPGPGRIAVAFGRAPRV